MRLKDEAEFCLQKDHEHHCAGLRQVVYFNDQGPASLDALAATKADDFQACDTSADDVCLIAFTSGTTGAPRAACTSIATCWPCATCFPST